MVNKSLSFIIIATIIKTPCTDNYIAEPITINITGT